MKSGIKNIDVLCAGLAMVNFPVHPVNETIFRQDVTQVDPITLLAGGDAANQSIVLANLGAKAALLSVTGRDDFGKILREMLQREGVDVRYLAEDPDGSTGVCAMMIRDDGQRNFCTCRGSLLKFGLDFIDLSLLKEARIASIGGLMSLPGFDGEGSETFFRLAKEQGVITVADTKKDLWGIGLEGIRKTLVYTDYFFPSEEEARQITGGRTVEAMAQIFLDAGAGHVGIKLGKDGCYFRDQEQEFYLPAYPCKAVDTTGAGDNFMAGFITGLLQGWEAKACCQFASAAGAVCASVMGPNQAIRSFEQIITYQKDHKVEVIK